MSSCISAPLVLFNVLVISVFCSAAALVAVFRLSCIAYSNWAIDDMRQVFVGSEPDDFSPLSAVEEWFVEATSLHGVAHQLRLRTWLPDDHAWVGANCDDAGVTTLSE